MMWLDWAVYFAFVCLVGATIVCVVAALVLGLYAVLMEVFWGNR